MEFVRLECDAFRGVCDDEGRPLAPLATVRQSRSGLSWEGIFEAALAHEALREDADILFQLEDGVWIFPRPEHGGRQDFQAYYHRLADGEGEGEGILRLTHPWWSCVPDAVFYAPAGMVPGLAWTYWRAMSADREGLRRHGVAIDWALVMARLEAEPEVRGWKVAMPFALHAGELFHAIGRDFVPVGA